MISPKLLIPGDKVAIVATARKISPAEIKPAIQKLKEAGEIYEGRPYDFHFNWSGDRIYCSELVWKMYRDALGIEIGRLQKFRDFDLSDPVVVKILEERFPEGVPEDETVISPASMFESDLLLTVYEN